MSNSDDLDPSDLIRRAYLIKLLSAGVLGLAPPGIAHSGWFSSEPEKIEDGKSIYRIKGEVAVNGIRADLDTRIQTGDKVTTTSNSEAIFVVGSDSFIMRSNSEMDIKGAGFFISALRVISGGVLSVFGHRNPGENLAMRSTTATIGIRGTGVYMEVEPDLTYLCTCYGQIALASKDDPNDAELLTAQHHDVPKYISSRASNGSHIRKAPVKNHNDKELKLLEAIVGREVPANFESASRKQSYEK